MMGQGVGELWERMDGTLVLTLDQPAFHNGIRELTVHCLVLDCPPNYYPEGDTMCVSWPFQGHWRRLL